MYIGYTGVPAVGVFRGLVRSCKNIQEGCKDKNCSTSVDDCKECLNQNNRYIVSNSSNILSTDNKSNIFSFEYLSKHNSLFTSLSGRSPPQVS